MSTELKRRDINEHTELRYHVENITWAMGKTMSPQLSGMFEPCKACALGKAREAGVSKITAPC